MTGSPQDPPGGDVPDDGVPDHVPTAWVDDDPLVPQDVLRGAVLVLPVARARELAQLCALVGAHGVLVPVGRSAHALVLHEPAAADVAAQQISRILRGAEVLLVTRSGAEGGSSSAGQLQATRWRAGAVHEALTAGVLLATLPDVLERLVLGLGDPADAPGAVDTRAVPAPGGRGGIGGWLRSRRGGQAPDAATGPDGPTS